MLPASSGVADVCFRNLGSLRRRLVGSWLHAGHLALWFYQLELTVRQLGHGVVIYDGYVVTRAV